MKTAFTFLIMLFAAATACAQSNILDTELPKWEIGADFLTFIDTTGRFQSYLIVKKRIGDRTKLRSRIGFTFEEIRNRPNNYPETDLLSGGPFGLLGSIGVEHYVRRGRASFFVGAEGVGSIFRHWERTDTDTRPRAVPPTIVKYRQYYSNQYYGLSLLAGVSVRVIDRFVISFDSAFRLGYQREYYNADTWLGDPLVLNSFGGRTLKRYIADFRPLSSFYFIYEF